MGKTVVRAFDLCKAFQIGSEKLEVLKNLELDVGDGELAVVSGSSGSGKTTLLNIVGGIDRPTSGKIYVFDNDLIEKDEDWLADFRCVNVGFVFQAYNLISTLTVAENVAFPMEWLRKPADEIEKRVGELLQDMNLESRANHFPSQLSGGEQQRVAFARALANDPPLLLIDEPTGNLDAKTSQNIIHFIQRLADNGKTMVLATHDERIFKISDKRLSLEDGKLVRVDG
jgi:putative ABC transport system ATP-binding protein